MIWILHGCDIFWEETLLGNVPKIAEIFEVFH